MAASSLLIPESPLTVLPSLAVKIGLNEAIFLQQVQYWISRESGFCDQYGRRWIYNTVRQWRVQFPFWSESTIKRTIRSLEKQQVLLSTLVGNSFNKFNKMKAYTIDYDHIAVLSEEIVHEKVCASMASVHRHVPVPAPLRNDQMVCAEEGTAPDDMPETEYPISDVSEGDEEGGDIKSDDTQTDAASDASPAPDDVSETEYPASDVLEDDEEGQNIKSSDPRAGVKAGGQWYQSEAPEGVNMTPREQSPETPVMARVCAPSSRARVTETTTENTQRIPRTTTGDIRSFCGSLGISDASLETFIRRYGEDEVREKACLLELTMQATHIRNPTGWLHAALKHDYTFSPGQLQRKDASAVAAASHAYVPPVPPPTRQEGGRIDAHALDEFFASRAASNEEGALFAQEFLRRHKGTQGRASP